MLSESSLDLDSKLQSLRILINDQVFLIANRLLQQFGRDGRWRDVRRRSAHASCYDFERLADY